MVKLCGRVGIAEILMNWGDGRVLSVGEVSQRLCGFLPWCSGVFFYWVGVLVVDVC